MPTGNQNDYPTAISLSNMEYVTIDTGPTIEFHSRGIDIDTGELMDISELEATVRWIIEKFELEKRIQFKTDEFIC